MEHYMAKIIGAQSITLSNKDQNKLALRAKTGHIESRDLLWNSVSKLAIMFASKYKVKNLIEYDDLFSVAYFGFDTAIKNFNPKKASFSTYCYNWMKGTVRRYVQDNIHVVHISANRQDAINRINNNTRRVKFGVKKIKDYELDSIGQCQRAPIFKGTVDERTKSFDDEGLLLKAINGSGMSGNQKWLILNYFGIGTKNKEYKELISAKRKRLSSHASIGEVKTNALAVLRNGKYGNELRELFESL